MITLTASAIDAIKKVMTEQELDPEKHYLRCAVKGGGCSGLQYVLDITDAADEHDEQFENDGIKVICDIKSHLYLDGVKIDYKNTLMESGFVFDNPNATHCCGCGNSFS